MSGFITSKLAPFVKDACKKYFSNFSDDTFNFDIGMWSGCNLQLDNLLLRSDVLDQFDLPFKVSYGVIGSLHAGFGVLAVTVGTPDVVVTLKDVYLVLSPPESEPYTDPDKEFLRDKKQKAIEEAEKKLAEGSGSGDESPGYVANIVLGVINNIKIVCENIHLRYEDDITTPNSPFSFGVTLKELTAVTADENYEESTSDKTAKTFFKVAEFKDLGIYWNSNSEIIRPQTDSEDGVVKTLNRMKDLLGENNNELNFILGPMKSRINAMVTMKPQALDESFSKPKAKVELVLEGLDIQLENEQFRDILLFGDSLESIARRKPYLKFRPYRVPVKGRAKRWWKYAYLCVRQNIERKDRLFDMKFLREKIQLCKAYETAYLKVIETATPSEEVKNAALELEDKLTVCDIIAVRRKQELYQAKIKEAIAGKSSWWSTGTLSADEMSDILNKELSPEDKDQLKNRLDLQFDDFEKEIDYPEGYEEINFKFDLPQFGVKIFEVQSHKEQEVLNYVSKDFHLAVDTIPEQKGLRAEVTIKDLTVTGIGKKLGSLPQMVQAITPTPETDFMAINFEKNPRNSKATQVIKVDIQPLEIVYDGYTLQKVVDCFTWPEGVNLAETTDFAKDLLKNVKNMSSEGIESLVKEQASMDLDITVHAPYILIPEGGDYSNKDADILAINLGNIIVHSSPRDKEVPDPKTISDEGLGGSDGTDVTPAVLKLTYNNYEVKLQNLEVFMSLGGENVLAAIRHEYPDDGQYHWDRPLALLKTGELLMDLNQCIVTNDPRFPSIKGNLTIPFISFDITDYRLIQLLKLLVTLPIPQRSTPPSALLDGGLDRENFASDDLDLISVQDLKVDKKQIELDSEMKELYDKISAGDDETEDFDPEKAVQYTNIVWDLVLDKVQIDLMRLIGTQGAYSSVERIFDFQLTSLKAKFMNRTFGTSLDVSIQSITSEYIGAKVDGVHGPTYLLYCPEAATEEIPLLSCHLFTISPKCPKSKAGTIKQKVEVNLSSIVITLHQESLGQLLGIVDRVLDEYQESIAKKPSAPPKAFKVAAIKSDGDGSNKGIVAKLRALTDKFRENPDDILAKVTAVASGITVEVTSEAKKIASAKLAEIIVDVEDKPLEMKIFAQIAGLEVANLDRVTKFPSVVNVNAEDRLIFAEFTKYKSEKKADLDPDMNLELLILSPKIILQAYFIKNVTNFVMELDKQRKTIWGVPGASPVPPVVKKVYGKHDPKIKMHVQLKSLKIILPRNDDSNEAFVTELAMLSVQNSFETKDTDDPKHKAVVDNMEIGLEGIKHTRALISVETQDIQAENHILYPVNLDIKLSRNLSFAWYDKVPQIDVFVALEPNCVKFSPTDVGLLASCALDFAHRLVVDKPKELQNKHTLALGAGGLELGAVLAIDAGVETDVEPTKNGQTLGVIVLLKQTNVSLYTSSPKLVGKTGVVERDENSVLAKCIGDDMEFGFKSWTNSDMTVDVKLTDGHVKDLSSEQVKDFIIRRPHAFGQIGLLTHFAITKVGNDDTLYKLDFTLKGFDLVLDICFLKTLKNFGQSIMKEIPKEDIKKAAPVWNKTKELTMEKVTDKMESYMEEEEEPEEPEAKPLPMVDCNITLEESGLVIIEDLYSKETNSIIITVNGNHQMKSDQHRDSTGKGNWIASIITAKMKPTGEKIKVADIIKQFGVNVFTDISQTKGINLAADCPKFHMSFSAGLLLLVTKIGKNFSNGKAANQPQEEDEEDQEDFTNVWQPYDNIASKYWFLDMNRLQGKDPSNVTATNLFLSKIKKSKQGSKLFRPESLRLTCPTLLLTFESGVGSLTTPFALVDLKVEIGLKNWSSDLQAILNISHVALYNNTYIGKWEYLTEPVEIEDPNRAGPPETRHWGIKLNASHKPIPGVPDDKLPMSVSIISEDILNITVSKTGLSVMKALADNFNTSRSQELITEADVNNPPYIFRNEIGYDVILNIENSELFYIDANNQSRQGALTIAHGKHVDLGLKLLDTQNSSEQKDRQINVSIPSLFFKKKLSINRAASRYYPKVDNITGQKYGILFEIIANDTFSTQITVRSIGQVRNELDVPVEIFTVFKSDAHLIGTIEPYKNMSVPLQIVLAGSEGIMFQVKGFEASQQPVFWNAIRSNVSTAPDLFKISATNTTTRGNGFFHVQGLQSRAELEGNFDDPQIGIHYYLTIKPTMVVENYLPVQITVGSGNAFVYPLESGVPMQFLEYDPSSWTTELKFRIPQFNGTAWFGSLSLATAQEGKINLVQFSNKQQTMQLGCTINPKQNMNIKCISLFFPYWMVNHTELPIAYMGSGETVMVPHAATVTGPQMFAYQHTHTTRSIFNINGSKWSEPVNQEAAMSSLFTCQGADRDYQVAVSIELATAQATKLITFSSRFTIYNSCPYNVIVKEVKHPENRIRVPKRTNVPFWPKTRESEQIEVTVSVEGTSEESQSFFFEGTNIHLLKLNNKYGGICCNVYVRETKGILTISEFTQNETPILFVNDTRSLPTSFSQPGVGKYRSVSPGQSVVYTWDNLTNCKQQIQWKIGNDNFPTPLVYGQPSTSQFAYGPSKKVYHYIFFPNGVRNIFVVTEKAELIEALTKYLHIPSLGGGTVALPGQEESKLGQKETSIEVDVIFEGFGVSLVDNIRCLDILYVKASAIDVAWEKSPQGRKLFRTCSVEETYYLEQGFQNYISGRNPQRPVKLENGIVIDYANFKTSQPSHDQYQRHAYQPGLGIKFKKFEDGIDVKLNVSRVEIDNNLENAKYPKTLCIAPIGKSVTNETEIIPPLLLLQFTQTSHPKSTIKQVNGTAILQEIKFAGDLDLITTIVDLVTIEGHDTPKDKMAKDFKKDRVLASKGNNEYYSDQVIASSAESAQTVYEHFEVYMLKCIVSFSISEIRGGGSFQNMLLGVGAGLISISDKEISINGLQIQNQRMTNNQLLDTVVSHYTKGVISNLYTVVLSLDCLGNPSKVISGLGTGFTKLFNEPLQGALQGNLIEGVSNGVGAVLEGTVFNVTDSLGKIVGSLGTAVHGIPLLGALGGGALDLVSGGLLGLGSAAKGEDESNTPQPMRLRRILVKGEYLQPYTKFGIIGSTLYNQFRAWNQDPNYDIGKYIMHYPTVSTPASDQVILLTSNNAYYISMTPTMSKISLHFNERWHDITNITKEKSGKSFIVKFHLPASTVFFVTKDNSKVVYVMGEAVQDWLYKTCIQIWKTHRV